MLDGNKPSTLGLDLNDTFLVPDFTSNRSFRSVNGGGIMYQCGGKKNRSTGFGVSLSAQRMGGSCGSTRSSGGIRTVTGVVTGSA